MSLFYINVYDLFRLKVNNTFDIIDVIGKMDVVKQTGYNGQK
jgi:hypothetical protein